MTKIAVSQRVDVYPERNEQRDALDQQLAYFLFLCGFIAVPVPNYLSKPGGNTASALNQWMKAVDPGGVVLSGGNNIGGYPQRDETEKYLISWAEHHQKPLLGICRGMQMLAVNAGAKLVKTDGHVRTRHVLKTGGEDIIWPGTVNSYHDYVLESVPSQFIETAWSEDGQVEAIKHKIFPMEGWMWHPERETVFSQEDFRNIKKLLSTSSEELK